MFEQLLAEVRSSKRRAYAVGTLRNLKTQWRSYFMFCVFFDIKPYRISPAILCAYLQFLSRSFKAYNTVINYLGAVKVLFELMDVAFPAVP